MVTHREGVAELPADIRTPASEARRAEEAGHIDRAGELYALAVTRMMAYLEEDVAPADDDEWLRNPDERTNHLSLLAQAFSLSNPRLPDIPLIYVSEGFTALTGYTKADAVGQSARFLQGSIPKKDSDMETTRRLAVACQTMTGK